MKNIVILIILFTFLGCTKFGKNVTVKGKVVNPITGVGISGVTLNLQRTTAGLPGGYKTVKSTTTDANGDFEISKFGLNRYELQCDIVDYYPIGWYEDGEKANGTLYRLNVRKRKTRLISVGSVLERNFRSILIEDVKVRHPFFA